MYIEIVNRGECFSTTMEYINGVYANKTEWSKHNFYPQNGMVGELVKRTPTAYIIKITDGIYIPMTEKGIREISYQDFIDGQSNNVCTGMDTLQQNINRQIDAISGDSWQKLPDMREAFKTDIISNITKLTCDFKRNILLPDVEKSCVIYATDMCLEYKIKSGRALAPAIIKDIANQVSDVYMELFNGQFRQTSKNDCVARTEQLVPNPEAREVIDLYYQQVNNRYSCS